MNETTVAPASAANNKSQFSIKRMYDQDELKQLESPDLKIKELQQRLSNSERDKQKVQKDYMKAMGELQDLKQTIALEAENRVEIESLMRSIYEEIV